ncbi:Protein N-acetyltransferase, RimJ/RimL family [Parasphingorhabdus marina DSM 22363]|uniref:Protein N-acetyltransferase, RimJ/RimL family n=1 Tax=Parasphingorhabdus marina DSM 22363 TaxID=1123272 RepID=A0A1N6CTP8_9SPHN|nr:GNAT family N-acetyltransferase [Parasphingorhabdus marina]SIN61931.1 Protein N-acetyltransferase, RimJ/RimL family [Parasphingorhabdus marina DSM 22363]
MVSRLETDRLVLREWRDEDRPAFAAMNTDPEVMRYFPALLTEEQSNALVDRITGHFLEHGFGLWALEEKESGEFFGFTGFQTCPPHYPLTGELEIGWRLARTHWRRGLAFEAASACLDWIWANSEWPRIVSFTAEINEPSWRLMAKLGLEIRPELAFDHPALKENSPLRRHVVYAKDRPQ